MLSVQHVTGGYSRIPVIHDIDFQVKPREIVGLIGLNGAGKSTTIKHILGLLEPIQGEITIHGKTLDKDPTFFRSKIAYIPETPQFYDELNLWEHLELTAYAYDLSPKQLNKRGENLLKLFQMENKRKWFPSVFSKGMQQKLMIICALLIDPDFLIVDEPFIGLDPLAIRSLLHLLVEKKHQGTGILLSTHILGMAEQYCDRFLLLHEGTIQLQDTFEELKKQVGRPDLTLEDLFIQVTRSSSND